MDIYFEPDAAKWLAAKLQEPIGSMDNPITESWQEEPKDHIQRLQILGYVQEALSNHSLS
jgi:hypothetical protein